MSKETNKGKLWYVVDRIKERDDKFSFEWKRALKENVDTLFAEYSLIFGKTTRSGEPVDIYIDFSPMSNIFEQDDRLFSQLSKREQQFIQGIFFQKLQFDPRTKKQAAESYISTNGKGTQIIPYVTGISETTGLYLHELRENNIVVDYVVAPLDYVL